MLERRFAWKELISDKRPWLEQARSGFLIAANFLIGFAVYLCLIFGLALVCFPEKTTPDRFAGRHPFIVGATFMALATSVMLATVSRWIAFIPGFLGYGAFGGMIMIATGHMINSRAPVLHWVSISGTAFCLLGAAVSSTFVDRQLRLVDRICLVAFVYSLTLSMMFHNLATEALAISTGLLALLFAWGVDRYLRWQEERPDYHLVHGTVPRPPVRQ